MLKKNNSTKQKINIIAEQTDESTIKCHICGKIININQKNFTCDRKECPFKCKK